MSQIQARKPISDGLRYRILRRDGFRCVFCGVSASEAPLQVDHLWPVSKGGGDEEWNLAAACKSCNSGKRAKGEYGLEARYKFIKNHYENIADAPPEEQAHFNRLNGKVLGNPLIWMDSDAIIAALESISYASNCYLPPEAVQ